jgi:hypothetical protein
MACVDEFYLGADLGRSSLANRRPKYSRAFGLEGYIRENDPPRTSLLNVVESQMLVLNCCDRKQSTVVLESLMLALHQT